MQVASVTCAVQFVECLWEDNPDKSCKIFISQFTYSANVRNTRKEGSYGPGNGEQFKTTF